jgi:hypothetical protein
MLGRNLLALSLLKTEHYFRVSFGRRPQAGQQASPAWLTPETLELEKP